jgi:hypothetical protein
MPSEADSMPDVLHLFGSLNSILELWTVVSTIGGNGKTQLTEQNSGQAAADGSFHCAHVG